MLDQLNTVVSTKLDRSGATTSREPRGSRTPDEAIQAWGPVDRPLAFRVEPWDRCTRFPEEQNTW